jgi:hypothetical protein
MANMAPSISARHFKAPRESELCGRHEPRVAEEPAKRCPSRERECSERLCIALVANASQRITRKLFEDAHTLDAALSGALTLGHRGAESKVNWTE